MLIVLGAAAVAFAIAAASPAIDASAQAGKTAEIDIKNFHFAPETLSIAAGTTVTWVNADESPHTIAEANGAFRSAGLDTNDKFSHTFTQPGEFTYICTIHPQMVGKIIVK
ncbi:MAG TPA: cupredoxin family copper-binding protein [Alphaproteobacteria bacterium]|nr:cupredoxin family copper-binding protein [Alphaproteobacteria bacterium]